MIVAGFGVRGFHQFSKLKVSARLFHFESDPDSTHLLQTNSVVLAENLGLGFRVIV